MALEPGKGKHPGCGGDRTTELIAGLVVIKAPENVLTMAWIRAAPNGIIKNKDFFKLHEYLDEGEEVLWFCASAGKGCLHMVTPQTDSFACKQL